MRLPLPTRLTAVALGLAASALVFGARERGWLEQVEQVAMDLAMRLRGPGEADSRLAIVAVDRDSVDRLGRWPWPRTRMAELIDRLAAAGARVIALDIVFSEPSRADEVVDLRAEDEQLARSLDAAGNVVVGYFFRRDPSSRACPPEPPNVWTSQLTAVIPPAAGRFRIERRFEVETNLDLFAEAAAAQGFYDQRPEGGVHRHYQLVVEHCDLFYPSLALTAVSRFLEAPLALAPHSGNLPEISLGERGVPADERGALWINYRGRAGRFATHSAAGVLAGEVPPEALAGRLVFVGFTEPGLGELFSSPFGQITGVEVHATVADNLLNDRYLRDTGAEALLSTLALLVLGPLAALAVTVSRRYRVAVLAAGGLIAAWVVASYLAFATQGWHLEVVPPALAGGLALLLGLTYQIGYVDTESRQIRTTFQQFVSQAVVDEMLEHPEQVRLGGKSEPLTVLFCDIRGFTSLAEGRAPEEVVNLLNRFFTPMTRLILEEGGTLDKYMGDALMAFFGAPAPQEDHAARACRAALAMREELARLKRRGVEDGGLPGGFGIGIGINSGPMTVGNMGSDQIFDYTVIGDHVNLGSRVEGLSRIYGVEIVVTELTVAETGSSFLFRELDRVQVKGRKAPVAVHELVAARPVPEELAARAGDFERALGLYRAGDFAAARSRFEGILERHPGDGPARLFVARCETYLATPPPADWDGVEILTSK